MKEFGRNPWIDYKKQEPAKIVVPEVSKKACRVRRRIEEILEDRKLQECLCEG